MKTTEKMLGIFIVLAMLLSLVAPFAMPGKAMAATTMADPNPKWVRSHNLLISSTATAAVAANATALTDSVRGIATTPAEWSVQGTGTSTALGTATTVVDTGRAEADNALAQAYVEITSLVAGGPAVGERQRITGNVKATGTITVAAAFTAAVPAGVGYKIIKSQYNDKWVVVGQVTTAAGRGDLDVEQIQDVNPTSGAITIKALSATNQTTGQFESGANAIGQAYRIFDSNPLNFTFTVSVTDDSQAVGVGAVGLKVKNDTLGGAATEKTINATRATPAATTAVPFVATIAVLGQSDLKTAANSEVTGFEGQTIKASYDIWTKTVLVDTVKPVIANVKILQDSAELTPAKKNVVKAGTIIIRFEVTDAGSGFPTGKSDFRGAAYNDVFIKVAGTNVFPRDIDEASIAAVTNGWAVAYTASFGGGSITWQVNATDRAGNLAQTDGDPDTSGSQANTLVVDALKPVMASASTGPYWDASAAAGARLKTGANAKRDRVRVTFRDDALAANDALGGGLDESTIAPGDFTVGGVVPISASLIDTVNEDLANPKRENPLDVFLTLPSEMASDAKPKVVITGEVKDKGGNTADVGGSIDAVDGAPPKLTTTLDATFSAKKVKVTITTDETLRSPPTVTLDRQKDADGNLEADNVTKVASQSTSTTYSVTVDKADAPGANTARLINVRVSGTDVNAISGTTGKTNAKDSAAAIFELDPVLNNGKDPQLKAAGVSAKPKATGDKPEVQQTDPLFITIDFGQQYDTVAAAYAAGGEKKEYQGDTHKTVEITKATVVVTKSDGTKVTYTPTASSSDKVTYTLAVTTPALGDYEVTINAKDEAGNVSKAVDTTVADEIKWTFKLVAVKAVSIPVKPGWNLFSMPFQPANPAINAVIDKDSSIDAVVQYDAASQQWLISRRDATTGLFTGDVTVLNATSAYFVRSTLDQPLSILPPPVSPTAAVPPAIEVKKGWNLVPILTLKRGVDLENLAKDPAAALAGGGIDANVYLGTLVTDRGTPGWLAALRFDPATQTWFRLVPTTAAAAIAAAQADVKQDFGVVRVGYGYWVYSLVDGFIIP
ncbi:MAG: hypothetical protein HY686_03775 [Chloroflexi bacterium]|nr:hypothetical protein [Chloroflexota bacterium]